MVRPVLAGRYGATCALVLLALCPNIVFTTAFDLLRPQLVLGLHASKETLSLAEALSNAGYAFGAVTAAGLAKRYSQRRLFITYEAIFVAGSLLALAAPGAVAFTLGRILEGGATGLLLVNALPPLITRFPTARLARSVVVTNVGLFGAVTIGPLVGGLTVDFQAWRLLFAALAGAGAAGLVLGMLLLPLEPPPEPDLSLKRVAFVLAGAGTALPFFAVSELSSAGFASPAFLVPVVIGLAALVALVTMQYAKQEPLMPVKLVSTTVPVTGILAACVAGAVFVTLVELVQVFLVMAAGRQPLPVGLLLTPGVAGLGIGAWLYGRIISTRWTPLLVLSGMVALVGGAALLLALAPSDADVVVPVASALLGFGAGAVVTPGLFTAALAVPSSQIGSVFALVELLRSEAAYLVGPVLVALSMGSGSTAGSLSQGVHMAIWITLGLGATGTLAAVGLYVAGGARLGRPDLPAWIEDGEQGIPSPPLVTAS